MIVDKNVQMLRNFDLNAECLDVAFQSDGEDIVQYLNIMVHKRSGEIFKVSKDVYSLPNALVATIEVRTPLNDENGRSHLKLLGPLEGELPKQVNSVVEESFKIFNEN